STFLVRVQVRGSGFRWVPFGVPPAFRRSAQASACATMVPAMHTSRPDLSDVARRLPSSPLTRYAPSPTGYLHLGHVVNAVYVWGIARALGGRVLLRIEDHDRIRSRPQYEHALLEDLGWLGFAADLGPIRQS